MRVCFILILLMLLTACQSAIIEINEAIPPEVDVTSAQELFDICSKHIESLWGSNDYYFGEVYMRLGEKLVGDVEITFVDNSRKEPARSVCISIDTKTRRILTMQKLPRADKIYTGRIKVSDWKVDSLDVFDSARQQFGIDILDCEWVMLITDIPESGKRVWIARFRDDQERVIYDFRVDLHSGEVLSASSRAF